MFENNDEDLKIKNLELIHKEVHERLRDQLDSIDTIDSKAGINILLISGFLGVLVNSEWFSNLPNYFFIPILIGLGISIFLAFLSIYPREINKDPEPKGLIEGYADKNYSETLEILSINKKECFESNNKLIRGKKYCLNASFVSLFLSVLHLLIFLVITI